MLGVFYVVIAAAAVVMAAALAMAIRLRRLASGGHIGRVVGLLLGFIAVFMLGYAIAPLAPRMSREAALLLMSAVFLSGAIFVVIVLRLIDSLVRKVFDELGP